MFGAATRSRPTGGIAGKAPWPQQLREKWMEKRPPLATRPPRDAHKAARAPSSSAEPATGGGGKGKGKEAKEKEYRFSDPFLLGEHVRRRMGQGRADEALRDLRNSPRAYTDTFAWHQILEPIAKQGHFRRARATVNEMKNRGVKPDGRTKSLLVQALANSTSERKLDSAAALVAADGGDSKSLASSSSPHAFNQYVRMLVREGRWDTVAAALQVDGRAGATERGGNAHAQAPSPADGVTYTIVFHGLARDREMPEYDREAWGRALLPACLSRLAAARDGDRKVAGATAPSSIVLDAELFGALCALSRSLASAEAGDPTIAALPLALLHRALPTASIWKHCAAPPAPRLDWLPQSAWPLPGKVRHDLGALPTPVANWLLMLCHRLDTQRHSEARGAAAESGTENQGRPSPPKHGEAPVLLTEAAYAWATRKDNPLDAMAVEVLAAAMAQGGRAAALVDVYFRTWRPESPLIAGILPAGQPASPAVPRALELTVPLTTSLAHAAASALPAWARADPCAAFNRAAVVLLEAQECLEAQDVVHEARRKGAPPPLPPAATFRALLALARVRVKRDCVIPWTPTAPGGMFAPKTAPIVTAPQFGRQTLEALRLIVKSKNFIKYTRLWLREVVDEMGPLAGGVVCDDLRIVTADMLERGNLKELVLSQVKDLNEQAEKMLSQLRKNYVQRPRRDPGMREKQRERPLSSPRPQRARPSVAFRHE